MLPCSINLHNIHILEMPSVAPMSPSAPTNGLSSLAKRCGAGGRELPALYKWVREHMGPSTRLMKSNRSSGNDVQDRLAFMHLLEHLKVGSRVPVM